MLAVFGVAKAEDGRQTIATARYFIFRRAIDQLVNLLLSIRDPRYVSLSLMSGVNVSTVMFERFPSIGLAGIQLPRRCVSTCVLVLPL